MVQKLMTKWSGDRLQDGVIAVSFPWLCHTCRERKDPIHAPRLTLRLSLSTAHRHSCNGDDGEAICINTILLPVPNFIAT